MPRRPREVFAKKRVHYRKNNVRSSETICIYRVHSGYSSGGHEFDTHLKCKSCQASFAEHNQSPTFCPKPQKPIGERHVFKRKECEGSSSP